MIKLMRESAHKYPWLLKSAMGILATAFVITMGWWGFGEHETDAVASVGNLTVTRDEFSRNGKFDPELYRRLLAANRLTPSLFEAQQGMELLRNKARTIVLDSVALTPAEIAEGQALMAQQPPGESASGAPTGDRILQAFLFQKQQRAVMAYKEAVKARVPIEIHRELL